MEQEECYLITGDGYPWTTHGRRTTSPLLTIADLCDNTNSGRLFCLSSACDIGKLIYWIDQRFPIVNDIKYFMIASLKLLTRGKLITMTL